VAKEDDSNPPGTEDENPKGENEKETEETDDDADDDDDDSGEDEKDPKKDPELLKAIRARDRAKADLRKAREELAKASKKDGDDAPDPVATANAKIVKSAARTVLAAAGVTDKTDQADVIAMIDLSDISVDDDGDPDEDEIEDRIEKLRSIFGAKEKAPGSRVPRTASARRKDTKETTSDPDASRYKRILGSR
jgi:hypothetical protein